MYILHKQKRQKKMVHMFFEQIFFSNLPILTFGRKHYEFKIRSHRELGSKSQKEFVFPFAQSTINHRVIYDFGKRILQDFNEASMNCRWVGDWYCTKARTTDTQWRHKSKKSENLGRCGSQNMLRLYLKIWNWDLIFGRAVKAIFSPGVRRPCL